MGETYAGNVHRVKRGFGALAAATILAISGMASGCASDSGSGVASPGSGGNLPDVSVTNVGSGESVGLRSLLPGDRPLLEKWYGGLERADALLERLSA